MRSSFFRLCRKLNGFILFGPYIGWITFAVAAVLQGCLLIMCCIWKIRQNKLGIDDFGNPVDSLIYPTTTIITDEVNQRQEIMITPCELTTEGPATSQDGDERPLPPPSRRVDL